MRRRTLKEDKASVDTPRCMNSRYGIILFGMPTLQSDLQTRPSFSRSFIVSTVDATAMPLVSDTIYGTAGSGDTEAILMAPLLCSVK
jgi:hypothetical protein